MISQILRQNRRSQLLAAAGNTDNTNNEGDKEVIAVFECKHCDKVSKSEDEMYEHVEECHRTGREARASAQSPSDRSVVLKGLLATSFQKNVYVPELLMCTDGDEEEQPEMYTVYGCTLCHYQHLSNTQVRKHGTMCHFLEIPVFSCLYCKVAVADRAVFHRHLEHDHRLMKVDFSFDCKALTLLNQFLSESLYQIHIKKEGFYEVIKDRSEQFTHYSKQKMLSLIPSEDTKEKAADSTSSPPAKTPKKVTRRQSSSTASPPSPASSQVTVDEVVKNSKTEESSITEGITQPPTPAKGFPRNTVRAILDSMVQRKTGTKKKYLRGAVKDLLKQLREESGKVDTAEGLGEVGNETIIDAESAISSPQNMNSGEDIIQKATEETHEEMLGSSGNLSNVKIEKLDGETINEVPEKTNVIVPVNVPEPNVWVAPKRRRGRPRKEEKLQRLSNRAILPATQKSSKEGCIEIQEEDVILRVKKEVDNEESIVSEKDDCTNENPISEQITPKRGRGRPRIHPLVKKDKECVPEFEQPPVRKKARGRPRKYPVVENDKEYVPQFEQSPVRKKPKQDEITDKAQSDAIVNSPEPSPGRYNFRNRQNNKSFTDELQPSEDELEEESEQKKPTFYSSVDSMHVKSFVRTFRKLVSKSEIPPEKIEERSLKATAPKIVKSPVDNQPPVATVISPTMQTMQPGVRPQTYVMVNGRLLPVINPSQVLQLGANQGLRPQVLQMPTPQQQPQLQVQQQPVRISLPSNPNLVLNLLSQPQQQQLQPILNQPTQQPLIIQQPGGLPGNQTFQLLPQNNAMMLQGSVPHLQGPIPNLQGQMPFIIRPVTSVTPNLLSAGNQVLTSGPVTQQQPAPVLSTNVSSTTATSASQLIPIKPAPSDSQPLEVKPIVIEPKEDLSDPIEISSKSDSETEADAEPEDLSSADSLTEQKDIKQYYIQLYVCRRCMQIFLTPLDLDQHLYIEELERNPSMKVPFSNIGQDFFRRLTITPMVSVLLKDSDWNLPVFRCGHCGIVHILESFLKKHVKEHALGLKALKESLWSPSDLRVLCAKGWTTSVKMQCRQQQEWAKMFSRYSRGRLNNSSTSREEMMVSISELEKVDTEVKKQASNKKAESPLSSILKSPQQPVLQKAEFQAPTQQQTQVNMAHATVGMHPGQIPLQGRFLNFVKPTVTSIAPRASVNQIFSGTQILQLPGTRILQLPSVSQPAPIQIMPITQPATIGQPLNIIPQPVNSSPTLQASSFFCTKCQFKHITSDGVKDHVLQKHMEEFGPAFKCTACPEAAYSINKITEHIMSKHPAFKSPFQVNRVYDPDVAAKTLIASGPTASAPTLSEPQQQQNKQSPDASDTVEQMEPDSSCDAGQESSEQQLDETTGDSNLSGISAPNILSCFSEEEEGAGRLDEKLLAYSEKRMIDDDDDDLIDEDASENMTGEAFACRLCAYSCDTEKRVKSHLGSAHISVEMYPFKCVSCKYESPSILRLAQHVLYKHNKLAPKNPPKLAKEMEREMWDKIMPDANKYERFQQEVDCLFRNCVEKC